MNASVVLDIYGYCMGHTNNEIFFSRDVETIFETKDQYSNSWHSP